MSNTPLRRTKTMAVQQQAERSREQVAFDLYLEHAITASIYADEITEHIFAVRDNPNHKIDSTDVQNMRKLARQLRKIAKSWK
jgi:hypothetical protein